MTKHARAAPQSARLCGAADSAHRHCSQPTSPLHTRHRRAIMPHRTTKKKARQQYPGRGAPGRGEPAGSPATSPSVASQSDGPRSPRGPGCCGRTSRASASPAAAATVTTPMPTPPAHKPSSRSAPVKGLPPGSRTPLTRPPPSPPAAAASPPVAGEARGPVASWLRDSRLLCCCCCGWRLRERGGGRRSTLRHQGRCEPGRASARSVPAGPASGPAELPCRLRPGLGLGLRLASDTHSSVSPLPSRAAPASCPAPSPSCAHS
jgi:hypothetical protein